MHLIQFKFKNKVYWGEFLEKENICLNFTEASGVGDIRTYLNSDKSLGLGELRECCLKKKLMLSFGKIELISPIFPGTIFGVGCNFKATSRKQKTPIIFLKAVQSLTGHKQKIIIPRFLKKVFAEVELGIVIGKKASIFGYTIVNDVTARGIDNEDTWFYRKSLSTFAPLGPWIVTKDSIKDHKRLDVFLEINSKIKIKSNTSEMIFTPEEIISTISKNIKLIPGDLIMMGCPGLPEEFKHEDVVRAGVEGIGILENVVVKE